jgi:CHASE3 domain sensor protein
MNKYGFGVTAFWLVTAFVCYINFRSLEEATRWHIHTYQVLDSSKNVATYVYEAQMYQRNYILTGEADLKKQFEDHKKEIVPAIAKVKALTPDSVDQQVRLARVEALSQDRISKWDDTLVEFDKGGLAAAQVAIKSNQSNVVMEELRTVLDEINGFELKLLADREKTYKDSFETCRICTFVAFGISLIMFLIPMVSITKEYYANRG